MSAISPSMGIACHSGATARGGFPAGAGTGRGASPTLQAASRATAAVAAMVRRTLSGRPAA
ncbi:hypothetical protein ASC64_10315 [Nocardioides sp. Root122]|nr:hypothetical protein ASC64_10315 [Nocardioides sp. Root122]